MQTKQELADGVSNILSRQANVIKVERQGDMITFNAVFNDDQDLQQRMEVATATSQTLRDLDVFTMLPIIRVEGNSLFVRFIRGEDLYRTNVRSLPGFNLAEMTRNQKTGKMTGPWPVDHNPFMEDLIHKTHSNSKPKNHKANRNKQKKPINGEETQIRELVYVAEPINYATLDWDALRSAKVEQILNPKKDKTPEAKNERSSFTSKTGIATVRIDPKESGKIIGLFLKSINKELLKEGSMADRRTRTAYQAWCHFMAAIGLVSQTQLVGALDRLQNDLNTTPCSMKWIWMVLSKEKVDPEINVQRRIFGASTKVENRKQVSKWTVTVPLNGRTETIWQATSKLERAFHAAPKGITAKAATPTLSKEGHYIGLTWS